MNVGQVLETHLGWACRKLGLRVATPIFDGISESRSQEYLKRLSFQKRENPNYLMVVPVNHSEKS